MKKYFLVYDDETKYFKKQRDCLLSSVKEFSDFETIIFKRGDIEKDFVEKNQPILQIKRLNGAALWKPYIISKTLEQIEEGDLLFYMDCNYCFLEPFESLYKDIMLQRDILLWKNKPGEPTYPFWHFCHKHVMEKYGMLEKLYEKSEFLQVWSGAILIKKTLFTINFINEWLEMCQIKKDIWGDEELFNQKNMEYSETYSLQHRHDQSLLGILVFKYNIPMKFFEKKYLQNLRYPW